MMHLPSWCKPFMEEKHRYKMAHGGRGSGKSNSMCLMILLKCRAREVRVLACREIQTSIKSSVHALMTDIIYKNGWQYEFKITQQHIKHLETGSFITFAGLKNNPESVKSTEGIDICFIEEAQTISETSMRLLIPTVRKHESEIWFAMNPRYDSDYVYQRFIKDPGDNVLCKAVNFIDNPWFPDVLRQEMEYDKERDYEYYRHTWEGSLRPYGERPLFSSDALARIGDESLGLPTSAGLDLSWSGDNALCIISASKDGHELFIHTATLKSKIPLKGLTEWIGPLDKLPLVADSARPEVIDMLRAEGYRVRGSRKGAGSVQKGADKMARMRKIWFGPGAEEAMKEFSELGYDENDELIGKRDAFDATRYAMERLRSGLQTISWGSI